MINVLKNLKLNIFSLNVGQRLTFTVDITAPYITNIR